MSGTWHTQIFPRGGGDVPACYYLAVDGGYFDEDGHLSVMGRVDLQSSIGMASGARPLRGDGGLCLIAALACALAESEPTVQADKRFRCPLVGAAEHMHERGHREYARQRRIDQHPPSALARTFAWTTPARPSMGYGLHSLRHADLLTNTGVTNAADRCRRRSPDRS
jgi:hypothetical protein